jgi:GNAT superfamily N-acetyltransferase
VLLELVDALAEYEKLTPPDEAAKARLVDDVFGQSPRLEAFLCLIGDLPVGYALIFETYSSFLALPTLFLEDLFVLPAYRKKGAGYALFTAMVSEAHERGCGRMEWAVLDWNRPAIEFYKRLGARQLKEWYYYRLDRADIAAVLGGKGLDSTFDRKGTNRTDP